MTVEAKPDCVEIAVADHGVGMTPEEMEKVSLPFTRAETLRRAVPGHGLGLFIAQRIVEEHGGTLQIESTPGEGSTVRVVLPVAAREAAADHAVH